MAGDDPIEVAQSRLDALVTSRPAGSSLKILDAGCGRASVLNFPEAAHVTGVDVSAEALEANDGVHEKVVGDLESLALPPDHFDAVLCWDVLEHLPRPRRALDSLVSTVSPRGLVILGLPNLLSGKGLVAKFSPLVVHVWFYRHVRKSTKAGRPGYGPFKTYLRASLAPPALRRHLVRRGLVIERFALYEGGVLQRMLASRGLLPVLARVSWHVLALLIRVVTLWRVNPALTEMLVLGTKPGRGRASE